MDRVILKNGRGHVKSHQVEQQISFFVPDAYLDSADAERLQRMVGRRTCGAVAFIAERPARRSRLRSRAFVASSEAVTLLPS